MRNKREAEPDFFDMSVDVLVYPTISNGKPPRTEVMNCRATPKRIYTPGGAVFDRATGNQIMARRHLPNLTWKRKAKPDTLRQCSADASNGEAR